MSLRPMSPPPVSSHAAPDLDSTAELPILDPAAFEAASAATAQGRSDTWIMPPEARAAFTPMPGAAADGDAAQPPELPVLLAERDARLAELEQQLSAARAELAAAAAHHDAQLEEAQAARIAAEQRAADSIEQLGEVHQ
jgi:hypothetical protein